MAYTCTTTNDKIHVLQEDNMIIAAPMKKSWIRLPKQLGGTKAKVLDQFKTVCRCNKHTTTLYVLVGKYVTMYCDDVEQWAWIVKPDKQMIARLKEASSNLERD